MYASSVNPVWVTSDGKKAFPLPLLEYDRKPLSSFAKQFFRFVLFCFVLFCFVELVKEFINQRKEQSWPRPIPEPFKCRLVPGERVVECTTYVCTSGLPDGIFFETKNPNLEKFWRALEWKRLVYSIDIWNILGPFGTYTLWTLGNLVAIWYISPRFETLCQEKSGSPVVQTCFTHFKRKYGLPMHKYCYMSQSPLKRDC
jgi:hypothetical protein